VWKEINGVNASGMNHSQRSKIVVQSVLQVCLAQPVDVAWMIAYANENSAGGDIALESFPHTCEIKERSIQILDTRESKYQQEKVKQQFLHKKHAYLVFKSL